MGPIWAKKKFGPKILLVKKFQFGSPIFQNYGIWVFWSHYGASYGPKKFSDRKFEISAQNCTTKKSLNSVVLSFKITSYGFGDVIRGPHMGPKKFSDRKFEISSENCTSKKSFNSVVLSFKITSYGVLWRHYGAPYGPTKIFWSKIRNQCPKLS